MSTLRRVVPVTLLFAAHAMAQQLDARFSCSTVRDQDGDAVTLADHGEMHIQGDKISSFRWESALHRSTHGFDCSIDDEDGLEAEVHNDAQRTMWRVRLADAGTARQRRGFDFSRGMNCSIRLQRDGAMLHIQPTCPALCGSRSNFSALTVNLQTGQCRYEE